MKRVIAIVLCFVLVLSGCSSASSTDASTPGATISQEETSTEEEATQATSEVKDETDTDGSIESHEAMEIKETVPSFKGILYFVPHRNANLGVLRIDHPRSRHGEADHRHQQAATADLKNGVHDRVYQDKCRHKKAPHDGGGFPLLSGDWRTGKHLG